MRVADVTARAVVITFAPRIAALQLQTVAQVFFDLRLESIVTSVHGIKCGPELADVGINNCPSACDATAVRDWGAWKEISQASRSCRKDLVAIICGKR